MIGKTISNYKILEKLGEGGMGVVYKAQDTKLGREVALKALPEEFAEDRERLARFEREAKLLASLNHPNIATIYGLEESEGLNFLTLELVEGETLAGKLTSGPIKVKEALEMCRQIAGALESAHEKGIIHRDLKPSNIKVTPEGKVKVLDFGLAKAFEVAEVGDAAGMDPYKSPTLTVGSSRSGVIMGTAAYMSPEQARGKALDKRTDIWSFGCVFYELLTGQQLFIGETTSDMVAGILKQEPDWKALPKELPVRIRDLLRRCLQKDPNKRLHDIADARIEIEEIQSKPSAPTIESVVETEEPQPATRRRLIPWSLTVLMAVITVFAIWQWRRPISSTRSNVSRFPLEIPSDQQFIDSTGPDMALSPDGRCFVYVGQGGSGRQLLVRKMDQLDASPIPGTEGAYCPFFSPDSQWVGFFSEGKLKKVSLLGGPPLTISDTSNPMGGSWGQNGMIIFGTFSSGLFQVSSAGGVPQSITIPDAEQGVTSHRWPDILPGDKAVLFTIWKGSLDVASIGVFDLKTGKAKRLIEMGTFPRYAHSGHLVYGGSDGSLLAAPFNLTSLEVKGSVISLLDGIHITAGGPLNFTLSRNGSLLYIKGAALDYTIVLVDRRGNEQPLGKEQRNFRSPRFSPDGKRLAFDILEGSSRDIWIYKLEKGPLTRLTFGKYDLYPTWTPDGERIVFSSNRTGEPDFFWKKADGSSDAEPLFAAEYPQYETSLSPDGKLLAYRETHPSTGMDIYVLPLEGERKPQPFLNASFREVTPMISPDGRWIAYASNESGILEVYVRTFPDFGGGRWQASTGGGQEPLWSRDGREMFYRSGDNKIVSVPVTTGPMFELGTRKVLFEDVYIKRYQHTNYDIHPDNKWFVMIKPSEMESADMIIVLNWFEELKRLVPVDKR